MPESSATNVTSYTTPWETIYRGIVEAKFLIAKFGIVIRLRYHFIAGAKFQIWSA
jgi:hypothetical protein